jgi:hypothetical protein
MLRNGFITAGGEIEKRQTFSLVGALPPNLTSGLAFLNGQLFVFGLADPVNVTPLPSFVSYQQLVPTIGSLILDRVMDAQTFTGGIYVVARFVDGNGVFSTRHFYDGVQVTDTVSGNYVAAHKQKLYAIDGPNVRFSAIKNATLWTSGAGHGIIDVTAEDSAGTALVGAEQYYGSLALFARTNIQVWAMDADPNQNQLLQVLGNVGLVAPHAVARYGNGDVLFLSDTGIRSLRARDVSTAAAVNDIGSPVDALIRTRRELLTPALAERIAAVVDPLTGRFWLVWGGEVFALSTFPNSNISAWSLLEVGSSVDYITTAHSRVVLRVGEEILLYGLPPADAGNPFDPNVPFGTSVELFDATSVVVETPFLDAGRPATTKDWRGIDATVQGEWIVEVNPDPLSPEPKWIEIARITKPTWTQARIPVEFMSTHLALRLTSIGTGPAGIANMAIHFEDGDAS